MKKCPHCGSVNTDTALECSECFEDISQVAPKPDSKVQESVEEEVSSAFQEEDWLGSLNQGSSQENEAPQFNSTKTKRETEVSLFAIEIHGESITCRHPIVIGRSSNNSVVAKNASFSKKISRKHAWVGFVGTDLNIIDLNSKHGSVLLVGQDEQQTRLQLTPNQPYKISETVKLELENNIQILISNGASV